MARDRHLGDLLQAHLESRFVGNQRPYCWRLEYETPEVCRACGPFFVQILSSKASTLATRTGLGVCVGLPALRVLGLLFSE